MTNAESGKGEVEEPRDGSRRKHKKSDFPSLLPEPGQRKKDGTRTDNIYEYRRWKPSVSSCHGFLVPPRLFRISPRKGVLSYFVRREGTPPER